MRRSSSASRFPVVVAIAAPLVIGVLLSTVLVANQRQRARLEADARLRASVASAVTPVDAAIRSQLAQAAVASGQGDVTVPVAHVSSSAVSAASVIEARDSGTPVLDDTARPPAIVVPVYRSGRPTGTTEDRRRAITAYRLVPLSLLSVLADLVPDGGGIVVSGPTRPVAAEPGPAPGGSRLFAAGMDLDEGPGWVVAAWLPSPATPGVTWLWVLALLGVFGGISAGVAFLLRREAAATTRLNQLERDRSLVTGLTPVLQASLDLAEVVPAFTSHLVDGLALAGLSLSMPGETGERQLFSWGVTPDAGVSPVDAPPEQLGTGRTFAMSLTRGGRVLGILRVVAGEAMERNDLLALATASDLLGSTLANTEAFARQLALVERMRSVDELKTVFLATASHELRTPVTAIVGFSALLLKQWDTIDPVQGRGFIERVVSNARGLETLIEQLLDFSQLERGLRPTSEELLDLASTITAILADQPELSTGHELGFNLAEGCTVRGSGSAVERIVTNLVGNAAKYSPPGTKITVTVRTEGDRVILLVDDEGPGVPEADRDRIFSRFYRGRGNSARTRGVGIGLAIVAEYAASMSGAATVQQAPTGGARFAVSFPAVGVLAGAGRQGEPDVALT